MRQGLVPNVLMNVTTAALKIDQDAAPMAGRFTGRNSQRDKDLPAVLCDAKNSENRNRHNSASQTDLQVDRIEVDDRVLLLREIPFIPSLE